MNFILRLFLTFSSVSFFVVVYLIKEQINPLTKPLYFDSKTVIDLRNYAWVINMIYIITPFILGFISLRLCKVLAKSTINKVTSIEVSNNDFLANYLSFFFVALSVNNITTFWFLLLLILLFTFVSKVSYFNPVFLVFGFKFYHVITGENTKVMLISKQSIRNPKVFQAMSVKRINDYTYIEI